MALLHLLLDLVQRRPVGLADFPVDRLELFVGAGELGVLPDLGALLQFVGDVRAVFPVHGPHGPAQLGCLPQHVVELGLILRVPGWFLGVEPPKYRVLIHPEVWLVIVHGTIGQHQPVHGPGVEVPPEKRLGPRGGDLQRPGQVPGSEAQFR